MGIGGSTRKFFLDSVTGTGDTYLQEPSGNVARISAGGSFYDFSSTILDLAGKDIDNIQNLIHDISTTTTALDFNADEIQTISITANTTFTTSNKAIGRSKTIKILNNATAHTLTFPAWIFVGTKPTGIGISKTAILTLTNFGATDATIVAAYAEQT